MHIVAVACSWLALVALARLVEGERNGTYRFLTGYSKAKCLDGSPGAYIIRPGAEATKFLLFHEGGGECSSIKDCDHRATTQLGSSKTYPRGTTAMPDFYGKVMPYFSTDSALNPLFHNYTHVYVRYCDGGWFAGDRADPVHGLFFRGREITEALVADLRAYQGLDSATDVVVGGCSAGGLHVIAHLDRIRALLPAGAWVAGYSDSGLPLESAKRSLYYQFQVSPTGQNGTMLLSPACVAAEPNPALCITPAALAKYARTPIFLFQSEYDLANLRDPAVVAPSCEASADCVNRFGTNMTTMIQHSMASQERHAVFVDSCTRHCEFGVHPQWMPPVVAGMTPMQAFAAWYRDSSGRREWWQAQPYPCVHCCNTSTATAQ